jgi:hypothetical protein
MRKKKITRGPCCAKVKRRINGVLVPCPVKKARLRKISGRLSSVQAFICSRHVRRWYFHSHGRKVGIGDAA